MKIARNVKNVVAERTDPLAVELAAKLFYASCICAEKAKYHKDCMQRVLNSVTIVPGLSNYKHFISSRIMVLITFVIGMSPPVTMQHRRLLYLKSRSILKTIKTMMRRCIRSDILLENFWKAMVLKDPRYD